MYLLSFVVLATTEKDVYHACAVHCAMICAHAHKRMRTMTKMRTDGRDCFERPVGVLCRMIGRRTESFSNDLVSYWHTPAGALVFHRETNIYSALYSLKVKPWKSMLSSETSSPTTPGSVRSFELANDSRIDVAPSRYR